MITFDLTFSWADTVFVVAVLTFFIWLAIRNMRNTAFSRMVVLMEATRLIVVAMLSFMLLQPELIKRVKLENKPVLKVLYDSSDSMKTVDVASADAVVEREKAAAEVVGALTDADLSAFDVKFESFAGSESEPVSTDINGALTGAMKDKDLKSVVLISDGSWNAGTNPVNAAYKLGEGKVSVFTLGTGRESFLPDLFMERVDAPSYSLVNEKVMIPFLVHNRFDHSVSTDVVLTDSYGRTLKKKIHLPAGARHQDTIAWRPKKEGRYSLTMSLPVLDTEMNKKNNSTAFAIDVRKEVLKVLVVETLPRWEFRYLRNALMRDPGVIVNTLVLHRKGMSIGGGKGYLQKFPETRKELTEYDVVFLGDVGVGEGGLTEEQAKMLRGLVESQGSGIVFLPGIQGKQLSLENSELADVLPVVYDKSFIKGKGLPQKASMVLTSEGREHLLTMLADTSMANAVLWRQLPGFNWSAVIKKAKPGSNVLAMHSFLKAGSAKMPLLVTRPFGNGNALYMGSDGAWRWRRGVEDKYHYRFWGQVVRWMAHKRHLSYNNGVRVFYTPEQPKAGDTVALNVTILDQLRQPLRDGRVSCRITLPDGSLHDSLLHADGKEWGIFKGSFKLEKSGSYEVAIECNEASRKHSFAVNASSLAKEKRGEPADFRTLKEVAMISGGSFFDSGSVDKLVAKLTNMPDVDILESRIKIWSSWWWGLLTILLLGAYWILRKLAGMI